jgi:hypothetical protein
MRIMDVLADATNVIAEGEVLQLMNMHDAVAGRSGLPARHPLQDRQAVRSQRPPGRRAWPMQARRGRGLRSLWAGLGHSISRSSTTCSTTPATADEMGKNLGDDLREGKATLPLISAMQRGTPERERSSVQSAIETGSVELPRSCDREATRARWISPGRPRQRSPRAVDCSAPTAQQRAPCRFATISDSAFGAGQLKQASCPRIGSPSHHRGVA